MAAFPETDRKRALSNGVYVVSWRACAQAYNEAGARLWCLLVVGSAVCSLVAVEIDAIVHLAAK